MKSLEESVVVALDGTDQAIFPFLPHILQDLWEFGSDPKIIVKALQRNTEASSALTVLDLGCGKGAVSITIAKEFFCHCYGIDGVTEFINDAIVKSKALDVENLCHFSVGDIRKIDLPKKHFDVIVLGSIGPVFGNFYETISCLKPLLKPEGIFIIDETYIEDGNEYTHPQILNKKTILQQIRQAKMNLIDEIIIPNESIKPSNDFIYQRIKLRCEELIIKNPDKQNIFKSYLETQEEENDVLENRVVCSTMVIQ